MYHINTNKFVNISNKLLHICRPKTKTAENFVKNNNHQEAKPSTFVPI